MMYGLIGERLIHSFSPEIHAAISQEPYELCELRKNELEEFFRRRDFAGINVTIPYKQAVLPLLDAIDPAARRIGAVNTVVNRGGRLFGYNTDYFGARDLFCHAGVEVAGRTVLILGSGGTSRTMRAVCEDLGAARLILVSRHPQGDGEISYEDAVRNFGNAEILVNTTPVGMFPDTGGCPVPLSAFSGLEGVLDVIYNPLRTVLIRQAQGRGIPAQGGLRMLVTQAVYASALFRGIPADTGVADRVYAKIRARKENLVLIGMPSCGKTTVGAILAQRTGKRFADSDEEIVRRCGISIPEIFAVCGETGFRERERDALADLANRQETVLATGGGAILDSGNVDRLKANGFLVFLNRSPEKLVATQDRPLSSDREALRKRYEERYAWYVAAADAVIPADGAPEEVASAVLKAYEDSLRKGSGTEPCRKNV